MNTSIVSPIGNRRQSRFVLLVFSLMLLALVFCTQRGASIATIEANNDVEAHQVTSIEPIVRAVPLWSDSASPPSQPVKLIFIHHSTGGHWLADLSEPDYPGGGLGEALMANNYFVSATNYGWGVNQIGSRTDVLNWPEWFTGLTSSAILTALYAESGQNICGDGMCFGNWSRLATDPGGENEIIMFKSCFPNSDIYGNPDDPPAAEPNDQHTVSNFKAIYNDILTYFETRQDKLFIVITAPPLTEASYVANDRFTPAADRAANARAFNAWLVNDWLADYEHNNVAVFDFYNVLTSNGSTTRIDDTSTNEEPHDYPSRPDGNHHYWDGSAIIQSQTVDNDFSAYPSYSVDPTAPDPWSDDHPTIAGNQKATAEFIPLLNVYYNRWQGGVAPPAPELALTVPLSDTAWPVNSTQQIQWTTSGNVSQVNLYYSADNFTTRQPIALAVDNSNSLSWTTPLTPTTTARVRVESVISPTTVYVVSDAFTLYSPDPCAAPLTNVTISGNSSGVTNTTYTYVANITPVDATTPIAYTWSPAPQSGQNTASATYRWTTTGSKAIRVTASNCAGTHSASDDHSINVQGSSSGNLIQPDDLTYLGAFAFPAGEDWAYSGHALAYYAAGDPSGPEDGYPGSLFSVAHAHNQLVGEITIPAPLITDTFELLPVATVLQTPSDITGGWINNCTFNDDCMYREVAGLAYLPNVDKIAWNLRDWYNAGGYDQDSLGWSNRDLSGAQGVWHIGSRSSAEFHNARTSDYLLIAPTGFADAHLGGRWLIAGNHRDAGAFGGSQGPTLFATAPWTDGEPPTSGQDLSAVALLYYPEVPACTAGEYDQCYFPDYRVRDSWGGAAWVETSQSSAVIFFGRKGLGDNCYGDSTSGCTFDICDDSQGWHANPYESQAWFYDPSELALVVSGSRDPWDVLPFETVQLNTHTFNDSCGLLNGVVYDAVNQLVYVTENNAGPWGETAVHVWRISDNAVPTAVTSQSSSADASLSIWLVGLEIIGLLLLTGWVRARKSLPATAQTYR